MSLILDALKKLDRDRRNKAPEGVVLLAPTPWPAARSSQTLAALALIIAGLALLAAAALVYWNRAQNPPRNASTGAVPAATDSMVSRTAAPHTDAPPSSLLDVPYAVTPNVTRNDRGRISSASSEPPVRTPPPFRLNAIGLHQGQPVAVLNDRLVREGDHFDGITVIRIGDTEVEIETNGKRVQVTF
ncbi:MAG: hypothetical protein JXO72_11980 [Vicinamibacteria bacterium]|nr:hypothetical protein [Vicinamibacteria bacterium]